uniref:Uncharacterized protein n=1 Tax=Megaselia scalaris TaxID=36166 RepID=T1H3C0_MEGSC
MKIIKAIKESQLLKFARVLGQQERTRPKGWRDAEYDMTAATKEETIPNGCSEKHVQVWRSIELKIRRLQNYVDKRSRFDRKHMEGLEILRNRNEVRRFYQNGQWWQNHPSK